MQRLADGRKRRECDAGEFDGVETHTANPMHGMQDEGAAGVDATAVETGLSRRKIVVAASGESSRED
jgi:hypothetical protein